MKRVASAVATTIGLALFAIAIAPAAQAVTNPAANPHKITVTGDDGNTYVDGQDTLPGYDDEACTYIPGAYFDFDNNRVRYPDGQSIPWTEWERATGYADWLAKKNAAAQPATSTGTAPVADAAPAPAAAKPAAKPAANSSTTAAQGTAETGTAATGTAATADASAPSIEPSASPGASAEPSVEASATPAPGADAVLAAGADEGGSGGSSSSAGLAILAGLFGVAGLAFAGYTFFTKGSSGRAS